MSGRKILSPPGGRNVTRPMTGRVKKSIFSMLAPRLADAVIADLYCGTGTLGIEGLSCGARLCAFAERDARAFRRLERNIEDCGLKDRALLWRGDATVRLEDRLAELPTELDLAFLDPPYRDARRWNWNSIAQKLFVPLAGRLAYDGLLLLRTPGDVTAPETCGPLVLQRQKDYGDMVLWMYGHGTSQEE